MDQISRIPLRQLLTHFKSMKRESSTAKSIAHLLYICMHYKVLWAFPKFGKPLTNTIIVMKLHLKCSVHSLQFLDKSAALIRWFMLRIWIGSNLKDSRLQTFYPFWINEAREKHSEVHWKLAVYMHELQVIVGFSLESLSKWNCIWGAAHITYFL